jgi:hypothetical protein
LIVIVFGFPEHCALLVLHWLGSRLSGGVVDAMKAVPKGGEHLAAS